ncbi:hypothetical protein [Alicyclobacillus fastidiosus]|nr:hypothetical protein [Alicyclobacillus fastidiosus]GMA63623.1 hypothetical protein GCM10025859_40630 [Alicyclobacillus fastidiosus]
MKEKASMIVVPSSLADAANIGNVMGLVGADKLAAIQHGDEA